MGRLEEAIAAYRRALELKPDFPGAHNNLGNVLGGTGPIRRSHRRVSPRPRTGNPITRKPTTIWATPLPERGQFGEAMAAYRRALELKPDYAEAHNNLGNALRSGWAGSTKPSAAYRRALELKPDYADAHNNLGDALWDGGQSRRCRFPRAAVRSNSRNPTTRRP